MAVGRHRLRVGVIYPRKWETDSRGNEHIVPDFDSPVRVLMDMKQIRSNRAEHKGQLTNEVRRLFVSPADVDGNRLDGLGPWTVVEFQGRLWDAAAPPVFIPGRRRTEHWEFEVKARGSDISGVSGRE